MGDLGGDGVRCLSYGGGGLRMRELDIGLGIRR